MPRKPNMSVTSRYFDEQPALAERRVPSPFPEPPPNREPTGRLCFRGPSPKLDCSIANLAHAIRDAALPDAIVFPDTSIFTRELDPSLCDAICSRQIFITPGVWKELQPWLKTPFHNKDFRNSVVAGVSEQLASARNAPQSGVPRTPGPHDARKIEVLFLDERFTAHGFNYYLRLMALRKAMGPIASGVLTKKLGRKPTHDEFLAEVQGRFGPRGLLLAKKGVDAANSPNALTDEQLVLMSILTAITAGREVFIVTRDPDVLDQYHKALCLMKEHYRAMLVADHYAKYPSAMRFREVSVKNDGTHVPAFSGDSILEFETTDRDFNPLPKHFHFVNIYCFLLGGESPNLKLTYACFCAESEMAAILRIKSVTGGLSTDKLDGRNCTIRTAALTRENHRVIISIGDESKLTFGPLGSFGADDLNNVLFESELHTRLTYDMYGA